MSKQKVVIAQDPKEVIPTEVLATEIRVLARGIRKMRKGSLKDNALYLLVNQAIPAKYRPGVPTIKLVFEAIDDLERQYLKKPEG